MPPPPDPEPPASRPSAATPVEGEVAGHGHDPVVNSPDSTSTGGSPDADSVVDEPGNGKRTDSWTSFLKELPILLLIAFGLAFILRTFAVQVFYIPSESMVPTLEVNDRIVVEKVTYRFGGPSRGDVVVFAGDSKVPEAPASGVQRVVRGVGEFLGVVPADARDLVKRVIGLPGDRVELKDGNVTVNGVPLDEPYARLDQDSGIYNVPDGKLFFLGDNRGNSADSRSDLGYVDINDVVGRAVLRIWPLDRFGTMRSADYPGLEGEPGSAPANGSGAASSVTLPLLGVAVGRERRRRHHVT